MTYCRFPFCQKPVENRDTMMCAAHSWGLRKGERDEAKYREKKFKAIKKVSEKMKIKLKTYKELRKEYLLTHPYCFANLEGCTKKATQVHHLGGRGTKLNAVETFMACCFNCHSRLHSKLSATERREKGLMI